jgi:hypothetical protein
MAPLVEHDLAVNQREQCPIATRSNVLSGHKLGAALPNEDTARRDVLAAEPFHAQALANAIPPVPDASLTFLVCHN